MLLVQIFPYNDHVAQPAGLAFAGRGADYLTVERHHCAAASIQVICLFEAEAHCQIRHFFKIHSNGIPLLPSVYNHKTIMPRLIVPYHAAGIAALLFHIFRRLSVPDESGAKLPSLPSAVFHCPRGAKRLVFFRHNAPIPVQHASGSLRPQLRSRGGARFSGRRWRR